MKKSPQLFLIEKLYRGGKEINQNSYPADDIDSLQEAKSYLEQHFPTYARKFFVEFHNEKGTRFVSPYDEFIESYHNQNDLTTFN